MGILDNLGITKGEWFIVKGKERYHSKEYVDSVRTKAFEENNLMGDFQGCIIADFTAAHGKREHAFSESLNNARLISASPQLLEALIMIQHYNTSLDVKSQIEKATGKKWEEIEEML